MRRALVTGVLGQDGGYLAELLVSAGVEVHGTVRPEWNGDLSPHLRALGPSLHLHRVDLAAAPDLGRLLGRVRPHDLYHLAALSSVARSWLDPVGTVVANALLPAMVFESVWRHQQEVGDRVRVLYASSAEIHAGSDRCPQDEVTPLVPTSPYGAAKAHAHHLVGVYRARGLHAVSVVLYPHESVRRPTTFVTRKITRTVAAIAAGSDEVLVLGNTGARRDWGWAPEYVEGMVLALAHPEPADFVLATGLSHSVADFVRAAFDRAGVPEHRRRVESDEGVLRPTDAVDLVGDASRAARVLGWTPRTLFPDVVAAMVDHDLAHPPAGGARGEFLGSGTSGRPSPSR